MNVSIIIPVYNAQDYITETIQSCLNQTIKPAEIVLVNDGSSDNSLDIITKLSEKHPIIKVYTQENAGPSITRNRAVEYATQEWVCFLDSDDILHPQRIEIASSFTKDCDAIICEFSRFMDNETLSFPSYDISTVNSLSLKESTNAVLKYGYGLPRMLMKRDVYLKVGGLDKTLVNNEDHELHFRMLTKGVKFKKIDTPLYFYRQHNSTSRLSNQTKKFGFIFKALDKMLSQVDDLPKELQKDAKLHLGDRYMRNALDVIRSKSKEDVTHYIKLAKKLNPSPTPYGKPLLNTISRILGYGTLEKLITKF